MTSGINPAFPAEGNASTASVRQNFAIAKEEIEELQTEKQDTLESGATIKTIAGKNPLGSGNLPITKEDVGLPNVDNTSDANKPVSTAQQAAIDLAAGNAVAEANADAEGIAAAAVAAGKQILERTSAQVAAIVAAGVPADKTLMYRTTDTGITRIWYWNGLRFDNLAVAGKGYDGAPSIARHAQRYTCANNAQGVRVLPLNVNVRKLTVRNKSAFILQISQAKYLSNDDVNIPTGGWVDIPVGNKATIWFPRGQVWCRYKTAAENNNIASIYAETEFIT